VPDDSARIPATVGHYAAFFRTWVRVTLEISVTGNQAALLLRFGSKIFVAIFGCRKKNWSLHSIEIRRGEHTATFTRNELATAIATLPGHKPMAPTPQAVKASSRPRSDTTLRERRTTVIRT
jgi:hypothetical protein